jgi:methionine-rich copper-binding protein CopC
MQFSEPIEIAFTSVKLLGPEAREVATVMARADKADARAAVVPLPSLASGVYRAQWSTMGHDGHPVKGEIAFTVK